MDMGNMDDLLRMATVPPELTKAEPEPLVSKAPTYDDLMALLKRVEDTAWGQAPDTFEDARQGDETRAQAKSRIMLEQYSLEGGQIRNAHLFALRGQYVWMREFVQGIGGGLPYSTHNWSHFYNRYGMKPLAPVLRIGLRKDTVEEMGRMSMIESQSLWALRLLGH